MESLRKCVVHRPKNTYSYQYFVRTLYTQIVLNEKLSLQQKVNKDESVPAHNVSQTLNKPSVPVVDLYNTKGITVQHLRKESANSALIRQCLEKEPNKNGMINAVDLYIQKNRTRRGHIDFISTAMKFIEPYKLEKEMEVYNKIIDVFPRNKFNNQTLFDAIWPKAHPQMFLALDILTKMEWQGVIPNDETHDMLHQIFGPSSLPVQKVYRFWFWFDLFKDLNPYRLPEETYNDRIDVIKAAIDRILENNDGTDIIEISEPIENENNKIDYNHFIISSQTELQQNYLNSYSVTNPLYIEGPINIWMNHKLEEYFIMKTCKEGLASTDELKVEPDEEREGVIVGVCFATKPYEETLQCWIKHLQQTNPTLNQHKIIFDIADRPDMEAEAQAISSS